MPARLSSMELSDPDVPSSIGRRKSGRVIRKPAFFSEDGLRSSPTQNGGTKRKRDEDKSDEEMENGVSEEPEDENEESSEDDEGEPDEEELKERRRAQRKKPSVKPKTKKPRTNNITGLSLAIRPVTNGRKPTGRSRKRPKPRPSAIDDAEGLYAELFARGHTVEAVAADWLSQYQEHNANAMCDLVNLILRCTGRNLKVDVHQIEDADSAPSVLEDLQEEYQAEEFTEYPLVSRAKGHANFRTTLTGFFDALIEAANASGLLYTDLALIENIQVWVTSMSSSQLRPFRHTATIVSLQMVDALCDAGKTLAGSVANTTRQQEAEQKKRNVNKGRAADLQNKVKESEKRQAALDGMVKDFFDAVFAHRYRDVDPKIRTDCVAALGYWIQTYPDVFFEGQYLRYLGWLLSDTSAPTRLEVIKQLQRLFDYEDNIGGLRTFTERFRPRIVEMATRDAEPGVRAVAVELLYLIREAGMLEPDDIDTIGQLIYDSEPRVRKAVSNFFVQSINDVYDSKIEELGGNDELEEALVDNVDDDDEFDSPTRKWLKYKCLVDILQSYDPQSPDEGTNKGETSLSDIPAGRFDSRFALATQIIYDLLPELESWESLAGYLLFDHSQMDTENIDEIENNFRKECKLEEGQETILLEILNESVKLQLIRAVPSEDVKKGRRTKARKERAQDVQERTAQHLAQVIPRLLRKFGPTPEAASAVLRLGHVVNLDIFQELRQASTIYSDLLDDINKQFMTHASQMVLEEASAALLHAKSSEELEEVTEGKVQLLWEDTINALHVLVKGRDVSIRGNLRRNDLTDVSHTIRRIANLSRISDGTEILEKVPSSPRSKQAAKAPAIEPIRILLMLVARGEPGTEIDPEIEAIENSLFISAAQTTLSYFMWKLSALKTSITDPSSSTTSPPITSSSLTTLLETLHSNRATFSTGLTKAITGRHGIEDSVRLYATTTVLDLYTLFATLRSLQPHKSLVTGSDATDSAELIALLQSMILEIPPDMQRTIARIQNRLARSFAKKSHRSIEEVSLAPETQSQRPRRRAATAETEPEEDEEDDDDDNNNDLSSVTSSVASPPASIASDTEDEDADTQERDRQRWQASLTAEKQLCEVTGRIVLAMIAKVIDTKGTKGARRKGGTAGRLREWLLKNKTRLGTNFGKVVQYLEEKGPKKKAAVKGKGKGSEKSEALVVEDDDIEDDELEQEQRVEEDGEEDLRRRELIEEDDHEAEDDTAEQEHGGEEHETSDHDGNDSGGEGEAAEGTGEGNPNEDDDGDEIMGD
ncbi:MAG: hypothetical protein M1834_001076 [Cirrosporium novae-zelandiae]|nr:MAG: hypothetical protein M1834_001076 [Cirrosporium novae-zelandiae]